MSNAARQSSLAEALKEYNASRTCVDKGTPCHAAETSMFFGRDGSVSACCYSRHAPIGHYPEQTIDEMWTGAQATAMRTALRNDELPKGCELCADVLLARNFSGFLAHGFDQLARPLPPSGLIAQLQGLIRPRKPKVQPVQLEFELSNVCNIECTMCSGFWSSAIRAKREKLPPLPLVYDKAFVEQLVPFLPHLKRAKFLGGEPFLIDIYYEIWERLIELNPDCDVSITTNGTVYSSKVKRILEKLNCRITLSLDSVDTATYEHIRKNAKLERVLSNFEAFCAVNRIKQKGLSIVVCPMVINCREIPQIVSFANERGVNVFFNTVVSPPDHSIKSLPMKVHAELLDLYRNSLPAPRNEIERINLAALEDYCHQIEYWMEKRKHRSPVEQRCVEWLVNGQGTNGIITVLSDLAGKNASSDGPVVPSGPADPIDDLKSYSRALWEVGNRLVEEGVLSDHCFEDQGLREFLAYLATNVTPNLAVRIYASMRKYPEHTIRSAGTLSAPEFIKLVAHYHGIAVQSVETAARESSLA